MTVVAPTLRWAHVDTTAAYAHGRNAACRLRTRPGRRGSIVWDDGTTTVQHGH